MNSQLEEARQRFAAVQAGEDPLLAMIPPGYQLTEAAKQRMAQMLGATNRFAKRALEAQWKKEDKKKPFATFEPK